MHGGHSTELAFKHHLDCVYTEPCSQHAIISARRAASLNIPEHRDASLNSSAFLDLLGIAHEDGLIKDEEPKQPDEATLDKAVTELSAKYPKPDVARYFWALLWQDPETWGGLKGRPELALD